MAPAGQLPVFDTVILAGGRAARMGGADKPGLEVGGQPMLVSVARAAAAAGTGQLIVVGPQRGGSVGRGLAAAAAALPRGLTTVWEEPRSCGPVPALRCGLPLVSAPWVAVLAADLPFLTGQWLKALLALGSASGQPGAMLADDEGRPQWLAACWQTALLRFALAEYRDDSLGGLLRPLHAALLRPDAADAGPGAPDAGLGGPVQPAAGGRPPWHDCDSPAELAVARAACQAGNQNGRNGEP